MCCRRLLKHGSIYLCMLLFCGEETKSIIGYILLSFLFTLNIMYDNVNMVQCLQEEVISKLQERMHQPGLWRAQHILFLSLALFSLIRLICGMYRDIYKIFYNTDLVELFNTTIRTASFHYQRQFA